MNYYGLTTQSNIQIRYQQHINEYYKYNLNPDKIHFCSSFIIFNSYTPLLQTSIHIVEEHTDITIIQLRNREKYYIHNFDSVNILAKTKYIINSDYYSLNLQIITKQMILDNLPIIHNITPNIIHIIQLLGYDINHNNQTLILQSQTTFSAIKKNLITLLQTYYTQYNTKPSSLLNTLNSILKQHNLQIITYNHIIYKNKHRFSFNKLLIYPYIDNTIDHTQLLQQLNIIYNTHN
jgi:hypothetical protein